MEQVVNKLCVLIPAYNEEGSIKDTVIAIYSALSKSSINHEILVVNDNSTDNTLLELENLCNEVDSLRFVNSELENGFGNAVRYGLDKWNGDVVVIVMADASDCPNDIVKFYRAIVSENVDCIFGNRFITGGSTYNYPFLKLCLNRIFNNILRLFIDIHYNDYTNAFKMYKRVVIDHITPLKSSDFSLTIELPLKAIKNNFSYHVIPNLWWQRKVGYSKLNILKNVRSYFSVLISFINNKL